MDDDLTIAGSLCSGAVLPAQLGTISLPGDVCLQVRHEDGMMERVRDVTSVVLEYRLGASRCLCKKMGDVEGYRRQNNNRLSELRTLGPVVY